MPKYKITTLDQKNASVLAELVTDSETSAFQRVQILHKLMEFRSKDSFFQTILEEQLSYGECPECKHKNHFVVPEDILNQMGWVSSKEDPRVKPTTNLDDCKEYAEACLKKKIVV